MTNFNLILTISANEEIAEVRSKYKAELSALQVQLRREQLKVQSLEKSLDQKASQHVVFHEFAAVLSPFFFFFSFLNSFLVTGEGGRGAHQTLR